jgi:hypothetical protein
MENQELEKNRLLEVEEKLSEFNNLIIENDPVSLTEEFNKEYRELQNEYEYLRGLIKKEKAPKGENFFNKVSMWLFFYFLVMFMLVFPLTIYLIGNESTLAMLTKITELIQNGKAYTTLQIQTLVIIGFLIYPISLTIINSLVSLIFVRSKENKKVYFVWNFIFAGLLLIGLIWGLIDFILPVFK